MLKQHWVEWMFESFVRLIAAGRYARASAQLLAMSAFVVACGAIHLVPDAGFGVQEPYALSADEPLAEPPEQAIAPEAAPFASPFTGPQRAHRRTVLPTTVEQQNIARFISRKYQLAVEQTQELVEFAYRAAREVKLDPLLILAVVSVESNFDPTAQSTQGAQGLMQVLTRVHADKFAPFGGVAAAFDPLANMVVGARILKDYLLRDGSVEGALKAYVGAATLAHDGGYGAKVLTERDRIAAAASGELSPASAAAAPAPTPAIPKSAPPKFAPAAVEPVAAPAVHAAELRFSPVVDVHGSNPAVEAMASDHPAAMPARPTQEI